MATAGIITAFTIPFHLTFIVVSYFIFLPVFKTRIWLKSICRGLYRDYKLRLLGLQIWNSSLWTLLGKMETPNMVILVRWTKVKINDVFVVLKWSKDAFEVCWRLRSHLEQQRYLGNQREARETKRIAEKAKKCWRASSVCWPRPDASRLFLISW